MHIAKHHLQVPIETGECILVHTLTGAIFVLDEKEYRAFRHWENSERPRSLDIWENELLIKLQANRFIFETMEEEDELERQTLQTSKEIHEKRRSTIDSVTFVLTYACNFSCPYCFENSADDSSNTIMTRDMVDSIFQLHNNSIKSISLFGGEPLLPRNEHIIRYIISKAPNARYTITTNGYYLEEYFPLLSMLDSCEIAVTLDGEEEMHNKTRVLRNGKGTYEKIIKGMELFLNHDNRIDIRMNISKNNIDSCLALKRKFAETYCEAYKNGNLIFEMQPLFASNDFVRGDLEKMLYFPDSSSIERRPMQDQDNAMSRALSPLLSVFSRPKKFCPLYSHCNAESNLRLYDADGFIYSCILSVGKKKASVGRYYPIVEMKENSMLSRSIEAIPECKMCKLKFLCGGGCANVAIDENGNVMRPYCGQIKYEIDHMLPALYARYKK